MVESKSKYTYIKKHLKEIQIRKIISTTGQWNQQIPVLFAKKNIWAICYKL